jgi:phenol 2-monooxygenase
MMDTYNLGWKLAGVLKGRYDPEILKTYQFERHQTAQELINLDYKLSRMFSGKKIEGEVVRRYLCAGSLVSFTLSVTVDRCCRRFQAGVLASLSVRIQTAQIVDVQFFIQLERWASGTATHYKPSLLTGADSDLASGLPVGKVRQTDLRLKPRSHPLPQRFDSAQVVCIADARPWHIGDRFESDGRFRVVIFAGDVTVQDQRAKLDKVRESIVARDDIHLKRLRVGGSVSRLFRGAYSSIHTGRS